MVRSRPDLPAGHGEVVAQPPFAEWGELMANNSHRVETWEFEFAGRQAVELRRLARREARERAADFSARMGVETREMRGGEAPLVVTGHQPELYHPGVWVKDFLLQRVADAAGADAIDIVVDSDGFDAVALDVPCMSPEVRRCRQYLALGSADSCFACTPVPSASAIDTFCRVSDSQLETLPAPAIKRHFDTFCGHLREAATVADNLAELITFARRRYEASAGTDYHELPVTDMARSVSFATFVAGIALDAEAFLAAYNAELAEYRSFTRTRSSAQPFPDLERSGARSELPFWVIEAGRREPLWVERGAEGLLLYGGERLVSQVPADPDRAADAIRSLSAVIAPKALALTLFVRLFVADLFIHGIGGGRYDRVTDGVCRRYFGIEPPGFAIASMTMYLPLGFHVVSEDEVSAAKERLNRLEHNPNTMLAEVDFDSEDERKRAWDLAAEKDSLVEAIAAPDVDKKMIGGRIRSVNAELATLLEPLREAWTSDLERLEGQLAAAEVLTDRTYPFCLWAPAEIADKIW